MKGYAALLCAAVLMAFALGLLAYRSVDRALQKQIPTRINWEAVPLAPPMRQFDYRPTEAQLTLRRERKRAYAALAFERVPR